MNRLANHTHWAHGFFRCFANYGVVLFALGLLIVYIDGWRSGDMRRVAGSVVAAGSTMAALGIGQIIGHAVDRARPYAVLQNVHVLVDRSTDVSFPSDHTTMAGAVAIGLLLVHRKWGLAAVAAALLMAITRVYVGAHYPGDVIAGLALGGAVAWTAGVLITPLAALARRIGTSPLGILVRSPRIQ